MYDHEPRCLKEMRISASGSAPKTNLRLAYWLHTWAKGCNRCWMTGSPSRKRTRIVMPGFHNFFVTSARLCGRSMPAIAGMIVEHHGVGGIDFDGAAFGALTARALKNPVDTGVNIFEVHGVLLWVDDG
jgi:hypothetical protein